jgi:hypothetical protein
VRMLSGTLSLEAFTATSHRGIPNLLPDALLPNAIRAGELWDRLGMLIGPSVLTSGFRGEKLNEAVGGSGSKKRPGTKPSAHTFARALDFVPVTMPIPAAMRLCVEAMRSGLLPADKLIIESAHGSHWLHAQIPVVGEEPKRTAWMSFDGKTFVAYAPDDARLEGLA